ncbi:hypothetical protein M5D96_003076 [Drosophila gunungcola]|uniref:Uncharacterized protein n=1 Tax=Drosophila gunungcola TaxID=103775 RepID=A0A9P9Z1K1_9MUSC|nr:hypothetical protein M5D96_003076 [Drosophila gunungcola]
MFRQSDTLSSFSETQKLGTNLRPASVKLTRDLYAAPQIQIHQLGTVLDHDLQAHIIDGHAVREVQVLQQKTTRWLHVGIRTDAAHLAAACGMFHLKRISPLTRHIQMLQVAALGERIDERLIRDAHAGLQLEVGQFRAATREQLEALVREAAAIGEHHALHLRTGAVAALAAQLPEDHLQRLVAVEVLAPQRDHLPQDGPPGEVFESPADPGHVAQLAAVQPGEDADDGLVGQAIEERAASEGTLAVPGRRSDGRASSSSADSVTGDASARRCGWRAAGHDPRPTGGGAVCHVARPTTGVVTRG